MNSKFVINWHQSRRLLALIIMGAIMAMSLQACLGLLAGGIAVGGTMVAVDRRTLDAQAADKRIAFNAAHTAIPKVVPKDSHINVTSFDGQVLLTGEVPDQAAKDKAESAVKSIEKVEKVYNELAVSGASNFTARSNDALITTKVKASLVNDPNVFSNAFKIKTERGIVYMMGKVTQNEAKKAVNIASRVPGVQKVVTLFTYISEEQAKSYIKHPVDRQKATDQTWSNNYKGH